MRKVIQLLLFFIMFPTLISCSKITYNAQIYSSAHKWMSDDFLKDNRIKGAFYVNAEGNGDNKYFRDYTSPSSRTLIITEKNEFDEIFTKYTSNINLDNKMVLLYIFADESPSIRSYYIKRIDLEGQNLKIYYKLKSNGDKLDAVAPYQRCLMVTMDKLDITTFEFIRER